MERCKKDGDNINNRDVVKEDRISELPEALILQILSLLPTEDAIATSVLSKQWLPHWKMLPKLKFDSCDHSGKLGTFSKNVYKALLSHKAPVLQSLHLKVRLDRCKEIDIRILIEIAFARIVRKLVLIIQPVKLFRFPKSLCNCETLETLKLGYMVLDVSSIVCLESLKTLHLYYVDFKDKESLFIFLSGCPNLENLMVHRYPFTGTLGTLTIAVPSLQRLSIYNMYNTSAGYVINAPSLKYLKVEVNHTLGVCLIGNVTKLVEANIIVASQINENPLVSLTSVKRLSLELSPLEINFPTGSIFYQLVYLELYTNKKAWWNLLTHMLDSSPKLQVLKLIDLDWRKGLQACGNWNQPKNVPECLLFHLETFMWKGYEWEREEETEVAKYILSNTICLKRATFSSKSITPKERVEMVEDLNSVVRASKSSQLLIE